MNRLHHIISGAAAALLLLSCQTSKEGVDDLIGSSGISDVEAVDEGREPTDNQVGKTLSKWKEGYLDIHAINSSRGECTFFIYPDGTTMLCDAGDIGEAINSEHPNVDPKPHAAMRPYRVYARYLKYFLPQDKDALDYMYMTHFHNDHFGTPGAYEMVQKGKYSYTNTGIMGLYDEVPFRKIYDRAYDPEDPEYTYIAESGQEYSDPEDYIDFIKWARSEKNLEVDRIENGSLDQLKMLYGASSYEDFSVQNVCVNGYYWDGVQQADAYPNNRDGIKKINENGLSGGFIVRYGDFEYLTCGDAGANTKVEIPLAHSLGRRIEAMKSNHHFAWDTMAPESMEILQPKVIVSQSFYDHQPDMGYNDQDERSNRAFQLAWAAYGNQVCIDNTDGTKDYAAKDPAIEGCKCWYFTNVHRHLFEWYPHEVSKMKSTGGHIVIRVAPKGADGKQTFWVYVLEDGDFSYRVKQADGPFYCFESVFDAEGDTDDMTVCDPEKWPWK